MSYKINPESIWPEQIVYEDNHMIVINKLPSEIVQGDKTGDIALTEKVKNFIKKRDAKPGNVFCGLVHRLDRPVSGLVILAKTSKGLSRLNEVFREGKIEKYYLAVTKSKPPKEKDTLVHFILKNEKNNTSKAFTKHVAHSQEAKLDYELVAASDNYSLLKIKLHTGRHHQIRAQLSAIGCPIKGDLKYGFDRSNKSGFIHLHSHKIVFEHPVKKEPVEVKCWPLIDDPIWNYFKTHSAI